MALAETTLPDRTRHDEVIDDLDRTPAFAESLRLGADATMKVLDQAAIYADAAFPDRAVAAKIGWDYPAQAALTEINGAKVRILGALDEFEDVPTGELVAESIRQHWFAACVAGWDLVLKIQEKAEAAPGALDRVKGGLGVGADDLGDLLGKPLADFLARLVKDLWWVLAIAIGVLVVLLVVRSRAIPAVVPS